MHTDTATLIGTRHAAVAGPSQDFGLAGNGPGDTHWVVVCDGCSSGGHTDVGARMWALGANTVLRTRAQPLGERLDLVHQRERALTFLEQLLAACDPLLAPLELKDGLATLGVVWAGEQRVHACLSGDGMLLARRLDGSFDLVNVEYTDNAPFYLNYLREPFAVARWRAQFPAQVRRVVTATFDAHGALDTMQVVDEADIDRPWVWGAHADADQLDMVLIATDGLAGAAGGLYKAARALMGVKSDQGDFLKRRLGRLGRQWAREGLLPDDDLTVAGVWLRSAGPKEQGNE